MISEGITEDRPLNWSKLTLTGDHLPARSSHSATLMADTLVIFGGFGNDQERWDFCHMKTDTLYCCIVEPTKKAELNELGRVGHTATCIGSSIYIFGGWNGRQYCNDGILYNAKSMEVMMEDKKKNKSDRPAARRDHTAAVVDNNLYIFAGWNCVDQFSDTWRLDSAWHWTCLKCSGSIPGPRRGHSASAIGPYILVFGGIYGLTHYLGDLYIFNTLTNVWAEIPLKGDPPAPRAWHTSNVVGKFLFIIGGTAGRRHFFNDVSMLDLSTMIWNQVRCSGSIPEPRASHTATLIKNQIILFGGITPSSLENIIFPLDNAFALNVEQAFIDSAGFTSEDIYFHGNAIEK